MDAPAVSVLVPTRGRPEWLARANESLRESATCPVEFVIGVDTDDETMDRYEVEADEVIVRFDERHGYRHLYRYYNRLAEIARAPWLFLWNDDTVMETPCWTQILDAAIAEHGDQVVFNPTGNMGRFDDQVFFPIFPASYVEVTGHVSLSPHVDTWIQEVVRPLGRLIPIDLYVNHQRPDLAGDVAVDATFLEGREGFAHDVLWGVEQTQVRAAERERLRQAGWTELPGWSQR